MKMCVPFLTSAGDSDQDDYGGKWSRDRLATRMSQESVNFKSSLDRGLKIDWSDNQVALSID